MRVSLGQLKLPYAGMFDAFAEIESDGTFSKYIISSQGRDIEITEWDESSHSAQPSVVSELNTKFDVVVELSQKISKSKNNVIQFSDYDACRKHNIISNDIMSLPITIKGRSSYLIKRMTTEEIRELAKLKLGSISIPDRDDFLSHDEYQEALSSYSLKTRFIRKQISQESQKVEAILIEGDEAESLVNGDIVIKALNQRLAIHTYVKNSDIDV